MDSADYIGDSLEALIERFFVLNERISSKKHNDAPLIDDVFKAFEVIMSKVMRDDSSIQTFFFSKIEKLLEMRDDPSYAYCTSGDGILRNDLVKVHGATSPILVCLLS